MKRLFASSNKYIVIYAGNFDKYHAQHVRFRHFTPYVEKHFPKWHLIETVPNKYPYDENDEDNTSFSDFYFYEKN